MHQYNVMSGAVTLVAATAKTAIQIITGSTRRAKILGFTVSLPSVTATHPPTLVEILLQTTAGTVSAATPVALDQADPAAIFTAGANASAEPTAGTILRALQLTPIGGTIVYMFPPGQEIEMAVSTRVGIRLTDASGQVGARVEVLVQE